MIEADPQCHNPCCADEAERRLQSDNPAKRGGNADRASRIRAHRSEAHSRANGRRRSPARSAGNPIARPRVARAAVMGILAGDAVREFVHVRLAEQNRAGSREFFGDVAIRLRHEIRQNLRSGGGANPARPEIVLERNRNSVERAARAAAMNFALRRFGLAPCAFGEDRQESVERGIPALDPCERRLHQIERRDFPSPQQPRRLLDGKKRQLGFGMGGHLIRPKRFSPGAADSRPSRDSRCGIRR